jgi:hypothetical protein
MINFKDIHDLKLTFNSLVQWKITNVLIVFFINWLQMRVKRLINEVILNLAALFLHNKQNGFLCANE